MRAVRAVLRRAVAMAALCAAGVGIASGQAKFEAASVKRMAPGVIHNVLGPGTVILRGDPLKVVLQEAFQVKAYQIVGPSWLDEDCFEIVAKMPEGAAGDQIPAMPRALPAERFGLAAHKEKRVRPVYALVVDKGGPKFKEANLSFRRYGQRPGQVMMRAAPGVQGFGGAMTMARLAHFLEVRLGRPVVDATGLTGTYDIDLAWAPDPTIDAQGWGAFAGEAAAAGDTTLDLPAAPTANLFSAIREALGLKLEARKEPVEMLVIDRAARVPVEN